jgi:hypothetical protein
MSTLDLEAGNIERNNSMQSQASEGMDALRQLLAKYKTDANPQKNKGNQNSKANFLQK